MNELWETADICSMIHVLIEKKVDSQTSDSSSQLCWKFNKFIVYQRSMTDGD